MCQAIFLHSDPICLKSVTTELTIAIITWSLNEEASPGEVNYKTAC